MVASEGAVRVSVVLAAVFAPGHTRRLPTVPALLALPATSDLAARLVPQTRSVMIHVVVMVSAQTAFRATDTVPAWLLSLVSPVTLATKAGI